MDADREAGAAHDHVFGQDRRQAGESRTMLVIVLTAVTMLVEVVAGWLFGSMALLADGLHMGSHAVALTITAAAYVYARKQARSARFSFGTGKVNALAGFSGAVLLAVFALLMAGESIRRFVVPVPIAFNQAILVAVVGLVVNGLSVFVLGVHDDDDGHDHGHGPGRSHHHDHNLRSAYLHVLADALTSVLAIAALLAGKYVGWNWMDPLMGLLGALLVARWSWGLIRQTAAVLLDRQEERLAREIRQALEAKGDTRVIDLHAWSIGPGLYAAEIVLAASTPLAPEEYRALLPGDGHVVHATIEIRSGSPRDQAPRRSGQASRDVVE